MPNGFTAVPVAVPTNIAPGGTVEFTLAYEFVPDIDHPEPQELIVRCAARFAITQDPPSVVLAPSANGTITVRVTITRTEPGPSFCRVRFRALGDKRVYSVGVNS